MCGHIHHGKILTVDLDSIIVKFSSTDLGVHKVRDFNISNLSFFGFNFVVLNWNGNLASDYLPIADLNGIGNFE